VRSNLVVSVVAVLCLSVGLAACSSGPELFPPSYPERVSFETIREEEPAPSPRAREAGRRRSRVPTMVGAGVVGALLGGWLGASACDDLHETDEECEDRTIEGALLGGGIGVVIGTIVD
jgi:uncharacterized protein YcfJ